MTAGSRTDKWLLLLVSEGSQKSRLAQKLSIQLAVGLTVCRHSFGFRSLSFVSSKAVSLCLTILICQRTS